MLHVCGYSFGDVSNSVIFSIFEITGYTFCWFPPHPPTMIWQHLSSIWLLLTSQHCSLVSLSKIIICGFMRLALWTPEATLLYFVHTCMPFPCSWKQGQSLLCAVGSLVSPAIAWRSSFLQGDQMNVYVVVKSGKGLGEAKPQAAVRSFKGWGT